MIFALILLGALPATLFVITRLSLGTPPEAHLIVEVAPIKPARTSREDVQLAA
jgi:hypothetical protein